MPADKQNLIWIDLEMTGLQPEKDRILEIAVVVTDNELNLLAEGPVLAVRQPESVLTAMNAWCQAHHGQSGLLDRVRSPQALDEAQAEEQTLQFLLEWTIPGCSPMCGNSICQDRRFLYNYMPRLEAHFHYRNLDVSTLKILAQRWFPETAEFQKEEKHLALDDIRESIGELRHYRETILRAKNCE